MLAPQFRKEKGVVSEYFSAAGFGIITPNEGGERVWVSHKVSGQDLVAGQAVEYKKEIFDGRWWAISCAVVAQSGEVAGASNSVVANVSGAAQADEPDSASDSEYEDGWQDEEMFARYTGRLADGVPFTKNRKRSGQ